MAKSHSFWVIIDGAVPTAFRAKNREDLLPTLTQLKRTQPNVVLMWFERGRVWDSPAAARAALEARRSQPRPRDRKPEWRPGGDHRDPRAKYQLSRDEKRARFKKRRDFERRSDQGRPEGSERPVGRGRPTGGNRPMAGDRPTSGNRPMGGGRPMGGDRAVRRDNRPGFARPTTRPRQYPDTRDRPPRGPGKPTGSGGDWRSSKPPRSHPPKPSGSRPGGAWKPRPSRPAGKPPRRRRDDE